MRNLIVTILLFFAASVGFAQEHLSFKGIPITGSLSSFCRQLEAKGLQKISVDGNTAMLTGEFIGKPAEIFVSAQGVDHQVMGVGIVLGKTTVWNNLVSTYEYIKNLYMQKYGEPAICVEYNPSRSKDNALMMGHINDTDFQYNCKFDLSTGFIDVVIESVKYGEGAVMIVYSDALSSQERLQKNLDEI